MSGLILVISVLGRCAPSSAGKDRDGFVYDENLFGRGHTYQLWKQQTSQSWRTYGCIWVRVIVGGGGHIPLPPIAEVANPHSRKPAQFFELHRTTHTPHPFSNLLMRSAKSSVTVPCMA